MLFSLFTKSNMSTRTDKVVTRSMTKKNACNDEVFLAFHRRKSNMTTRIDKAVTRSMTKKKACNNEVFLAFHRSSLDNTFWSPRFHYGKCNVGDSSDDDDEEYHEPCRCCLARLFRREGLNGRSPRVACKTCFNWKGSIPYSDECCD